MTLLSLSRYGVRSLVSMTSRRSATSGSAAVASTTMMMKAAASAATASSATASATASATRYFSTMDEMETGTKMYMSLYPEGSTDGALRLGNM